MNDIAPSRHSKRTPGLKPKFINRRFFAALEGPLFHGDAIGGGAVTEKLARGSSRSDLYGDSICD